jgi:hypothetical protein
MAGLTISNDRTANTVWGNKRVKVFDITFDSSYPTGGESLTASDLGFKKIEQFIPQGPAVDSDGTGGTHAVSVRYDYSTAKLQAFQQVDPADTGGDDIPFLEVESTDSLANYLVRVTVVGY